MNDLPFWERPEVVERFGARDPDRRLVSLLDAEGARGLRSFDLGCAAGRNCRYLAERGADVWAMDASAAMVAAARRQLAGVLGEAEAARRVLRGRMHDLSAFGRPGFDLVLLLGVLQNAGSDAELDRTLDEVRRVTTPNGHCLVANFAPGSMPAGVPLEPVAGESRVFSGFGGPHRRIALLGPEALDAAFGRRGFEPATPTVEVRVPTDRGFRITVNALYLRSGA